MVLWMDSLHADTSTSVFIAAIVASIGGLALYQQRRHLHVNSDTKNTVSLTYQLTRFHDFILEKVPDFSENYQPPWWADNAHLHILWTLLFTPPSIPYERQELLMKDGGTIALDWAVDSSNSLTESSPIIIVIHGITGSSETVRGFCKQALQAGYRTVAFNKRGHGGSTLTTPRLQEFGCISDLSEVVDHVAEKYPEALRFAVGFSAGSASVVLYLTTHGENSKIHAGVGIGPGFDAYKLFGGENMGSYNRLLTHSLQKFIKPHRETLSEAIDFDAAMKAKTIMEFDLLVFAKLNGYTCMKEYWKQNNPINNFQNLKRPLLCICALDDPICTKDLINYDMFHKVDTAMLMVTEKGSHCGFLWNDPANPSYKPSDFGSWADKKTIDYLDACVTFEREKKVTEMKENLHE